MSDIDNEIDPDLESLLHTDIHHGLTNEEVGKRTERFGLNGNPKVTKNCQKKRLAAG